MRELTRGGTRTCRGSQANRGTEQRPGHERAARQGEHRPPGIDDVRGLELILLAGEINHNSPSCWVKRARFKFAAQ